MHFSHNDVMIIIMLIVNCRVSKILIDGESVVTILYGGALDKMENTSEIARAMINSQIRSHLYVFDENETHSPGTIALPVRIDH